MLIIDNNIEDLSSEYFQNRFSKYLASRGIPVRFIRQIKLKLKEIKNPSQEPIVLSGSAASITDDFKWEEPIKNLIQECHQKSIPLLGICHGHQLIIKTLFGKSHVRRAQKPEHGWHKILATDSYKNNKLFLNIELPPYFTSLHFDEVCDLPNECETILYSQHCSVQGMGFKNKPIWGLQFHPEVDVQEGRRTINEMRKTRDLFDLNFKDLEPDSKYIDVFEKMMNNFLLP